MNSFEEESNLKIDLSEKNVLCILIDLVKKELLGQHYFTLEGIHE